MARREDGGSSGLDIPLQLEFSLWSADLTRIADEIARVEPYADVYHVDVADGHFAPALLFFPDLVQAIRRLTGKPLHVHLMVRDSILESQIRQFAAAGANRISIHVENARVSESLQVVEDLGCEAGLVLQVDTPVEALAPFADRVRFVTLLGTRIGVKGQGLDAAACDRLQHARALLPRAFLAADGGIRENTVPMLRRAGADSVVMGSLAFGAADLAARAEWARSLPKH